MRWERLVTFLVVLNTFTELLRIFSDYGQCFHATGDCVANEQYIRQLKETLATSVPPRIAAFFAEPIQVGFVMFYNNI